jgi:hypothetical protein
MTTFGKFTLRHLLIFVLLTISAFSVSASFGQDSGRSPLKTVILVTADPQTLPLNYKTVEALILSNCTPGTEADNIRDFVTLTALSTVDKSPVLVSLDIHLPDNSKTTPQEVLAAVTEELRKSLVTIHQAQIDTLNSRLSTAKRIRTEAEKKLSEAIRQEQSTSTERIEFDSEDQAVYTQLKQRVDLSWLNPNMGFSEAIERIRQSVTPPLNITVLWKDLLDNAEVEPNTSIDMDGLTNVRLETALDSLLDAIGAGFYDIAYTVNDRQIIIGTFESLPIIFETRTYRIPLLIRAAYRTRTFLQALPEAIEPDSWFYMSDLGQGTITPISETHFAVLQTRKTHIAIQAQLERLQLDPVVSIPDYMDPNTLTAHLAILRRHRGDILSEKETAKESLGLPEKKESVLDGPFVMNEMLLARTFSPRQDQVDAKIATLERLLGPKRLDPDISRIHWTAKQIEQANARIAAIEEQIADRVLPTVTVIARGDVPHSTTSLK